MTAKKDDYKKLDLGRAYDQAEQAAETAPKRGRGRPRRTYTPEEAWQVMKAGENTRGRKGVKLPRMNMAFDLDVYEYIRAMSKATGKNMTEFVNEALRQHATKNDKIYKKVLEIRKELFGEE